MVSLAAFLLVSAEPTSSAAPRSRNVVASRSDARAAHGALVTGTSVGSPNEGHLVGGVRLEMTSSLRITPAYAATDNRWGLPELVGLLDRSAKKVASRYPGAVLSVGDLSQKGGGDVHRHHSHESGRDADVGFYLLGANGKPALPSTFITFGPHDTPSETHGFRFDDARNWALVETWMNDPTARVSHIFVAPHLRSRLLAYAARLRVSAAIRDRAALTLLQPKQAVPHDDHFHVRIACPDEQQERCVENPAEVTSPHQTASKGSLHKNRPLLARARKRSGTSGPLAPPLAGVAPAGNDFQDDKGTD